MNRKVEKRLMLFAGDHEAGLKHTRGTVHQAFPKGGPDPSGTPWSLLNCRVRVCNNSLLLRNRSKLCRCQLRCRAYVIIASNVE
jgi:hypothetical protein